MNMHAKKNDWLTREPDLKLARRLNGMVAVLTIVVFGLVGAMRQFKFALPDGITTDWLPALYSFINLCVAVTLIVAVLFIKRGQVARHRAAINTALAGSTLFLLLYVVYHFTNQESRFAGEGPIRYLYFALLISHVVLAALSFPFILYTWVLGTTNQFARHRRFTHFVFPVWLYVAVTGPVCHALLRFCMPAAG
jgi:putative membrane protein